MSQLLMDDAVKTARCTAASAGVSPEPALLAAPEDELDWAENQVRPGREAARLDFRLVGIAVMLAAALVAGAVGVAGLL